MKIGIFDSGLGGLVVMKEFLEKLPEYDYVYYGDTQNMPYGDKSHDQIFEYTKKGVNFLMKQGCGLVVVACNSASAQALRQLQQTWLPSHYPERKVLGVLIPLAEEVVRAKVSTVGIIATRATVSSNAYIDEIHKLSPSIEVKQIAIPGLVERIESGEVSGFEEMLADVKEEFKDVDLIVPGCTHYPLISDFLSNYLQKNILNAPLCIANALQMYLKNHPEIDSLLSKAGVHTYFLSKISPHYKDISKRLFGREIEFVLKEG